MFDTKYVLFEYSLDITGKGEQPKRENGIEIVYIGCIQSRSYKVAKASKTSAMAINDPPVHANDCSTVWGSPSFVTKLKVDP